MAKVIGVGGPKGGTGKSTVAQCAATYCARLTGLRTLLVDADPNRSSLDAATDAGDAMPFDVAEGLDHHRLTQLHGTHHYDVVFVDLPGARETGALAALLDSGQQHDHRRRAPIDLLLVPTRPEIADIRPTLRMMRQEVLSLRVPYLIVLVRVRTTRVPHAEANRAELVYGGWHVAEAMTRMLAVHDDTLAEQRPLMDMPGGKRSSVRAADREYRTLTVEALEHVGLDASALRSTIQED